MEYPLKRRGIVYNAGPKTKNQGDERVVYYWTSERDTENHPKAYYCGIMTHVGQEPGQFVLCE